MVQVLRGWLVFSLLAFFTRGTQAAVLVVDPAGAADFREIQPAVQAASAGDTVLVKPGKYVLQSPILLSGKSITLRSSSGPEVTVLRMAREPVSAQQASVIVVSGTPSPLIEGFTITGGRGTGPNGTRFGGGVLCTNGTTPTFKNCTFRQNAAHHFKAAGFTASRDLPLSLQTARLQETSLNGVAAAFRATGNAH